MAFQTWRISLWQLYGRLCVMWMQAPSMSSAGETAIIFRGRMKRDIKRDRKYKIQMRHWWSWKMNFSGIVGIKNGLEEVLSAGAFWVHSAVQLQRNNSTINVILLMTSQRFFRAIKAYNFMQTEFIQTKTRVLVTKCVVIARHKTGVLINHTATGTRAKQIVFF